MDNDTYEFLRATSSSKDFPPLYNSRADLCIEYEETDEDDELQTEFPCPYCSDDLDIVELCYHIEDEHYDQERAGVCPVCATRVSSNMLGHITSQHGKMIKIQQRLKLLKDEPDATLSFLKKELYEEHLKSLLESSCTVSTPNMAPDPLLSSFMYSLPTFTQPEVVQPSSSIEPLPEKSSEETTVESDSRPPPLSDKDQEEKKKRSDFVQGLLWSTFFDDNL